MAAAIHPRTGIGLRPGDVLVVLHDFNARTADELTLRKSDRVELMEMDDGFGDGWYLGRHMTRGGTGLFPGVYTAKATNTVRSAYNTNPGRSPQSVADVKQQVVATDNDALSKPLPVPAEQQSQPEDNIGRAVSHTYNSSRDSTRTSVPPTYTSYAPAVQRSIGETLSASDRNGASEDSPVMNETLSVIDEHITDLSTPRQSLAPPTYTINEDSESEYSRDLDRNSRVVGPETDDEENEILNEATVRNWDHKKTARYLRSMGVDSAHCDIFEEQEISGDVLLDMDQSFIHMKEYNFGVMGRRLKTWHKIREIQDQVRTGHKAGRQGTFSSNERNSLADDASFNSSRVGSGSAGIPRMPSKMDKQGLHVRHRQGSGSINDEATPAPLQTGAYRTSRGAATPPSPWRASMMGDAGSRPSPAMVRELAHSRRHSSIDVNKASDQSLPSYYSAGPSPPLHQKQSSMDRGWTMSGSLSARGTPQIPQGAMASGQDLAASPTDMTPPPVDVDLDRGYFSGNEVDKRRRTSMLRKRNSDATAGHSRRLSNTAAAFKKHGRVSSSDSPKDSSGNSAAANAYHSGAQKGRVRSASARSFTSRPVADGSNTPAVTNLEKEGMLSNTRNSSGSASNALASMQNKAKKLIGLRAASENLSHSEKTIVGRDDNSLDETMKISPDTSQAGSATASQASHSMDYGATDSYRKITEVGHAPLPRAAARTRAKGKQDTSAYTRGLLKITPEEARQTCDYHGWMKKKSSSLMTTWKPRLFILRGRRLSYYYSESDTEERGIIDISGHKVLVANNDAMVTLHAQLTGATSPASNPSSAEPSPRTNSGSYVSTIPFYYKKVQAGAGKSETGTSAEPTPTTTPISPPGTNNPFYFKLVPPKSGFSRAVQFTKPAIHYFQVDSIAEGRKWMGELMKATIMHDWSTLESTNKQKTISLAKARARGERPTALLGEDEEEQQSPAADESRLEKNEQDAGGLNIQGLKYEAADGSLSTLDEKKDSKTDSGVGQAADVETAHEETAAKTAAPPQPESTLIADTKVETEAATPKPA